MVWFALGNNVKNILSKALGYIYIGPSMTKSLASILKKPYVPIIKLCFVLKHDVRPCL